MKTMRVVVMAAVAVSCFTMTGCAHKIKLQVTNATSQALPVEVSAMEFGHREIGVVGPNSSMMQKLKFDKKYLPQPMSIRVGRLEQELMVTKHRKNYRVDVTLEGKIRSRGEEVLEEEIKVEKQIPLTEPEEVIE